MQGKLLEGLFYSIGYGICMIAKDGVLRRLFVHMQLSIFMLMFPSAV